MEEDSFITDDREWGEEYYNKNIRGGEYSVPEKKGSIKLNL